MGLKYYKVIALSVSGRKRIFNTGDRVNENNFAPGLAEQLVKQGFLEFLEEDLEPGQERLDISNDTQPKVNLKEPELPPVEKVIEPDMDDVTRREIMDKLDERGVAYSKNLSKAELYELYRKE